MDNKENIVPDLDQLAVPETQGGSTSTSSNSNLQHHPAKPVPGAPSLTGKAARLPLKDITHLFDATEVGPAIGRPPNSNAVATTRWKSSTQTELPPVSLFSH